MANPLRVNAAELLRRPGSEKTVEMQAALADLEVVDPNRFSDDAVVSVRLHLEALTDGIVVDGELSVPWFGVPTLAMPSVSPSGSLSLASRPVAAGTLSTVSACTV